MDFLSGFKGSKEKAVNKVVMLPVDKIEPNTAQPRQIFNDCELDTLGESIKTNGLLQPVSVRRSNDKYEIIAGERRFRACKKIGMSEIPAIITDADDQQSAVLAIIENLQRSDLNMFEEASGIRLLINQWGITQEQAATRLSMAQSTVANKLRLLKLDNEVQSLILSNNLTERHARCLLKLDDPHQQKTAAENMVKRGLNVNQSEQMITDMLEKHTRKKPTKKMVVRDVRLFLNSFKRAIDAMKLSGIDAKSKCNENEDFLEYTVTIPKPKTSAK